MEHSQLVDGPTQATLKSVSIDDFVFGVAAIGPDGQESLVSAYVARPAVEPAVKILK